MRSTALQTTSLQTLAFALQLSSRLSAISQIDREYSEIPVITQAEFAELERAMAVMSHALTAGSTADQISDMIGEIALAYPAGRMSDEEAEAQNMVYCDLLKDIPADILREAFRRAAQESRFFPTVAELRQHAQAERRKRGALFNRLKLIAAKYDLERPA